MILILIYSPVLTWICFFAAVLSSLRLQPATTFSKCEPCQRDRLQSRRYCSHQRQCSTRWLLPSKGTIKTQRAPMHKSFISSIYFFLCRLEAKMVLFLPRSLKKWLLFSLEARGWGRMYMHHIHEFELFNSKFFTLGYLYTTSSNPCSVSSHCYSDHFSLCELAVLLFQLTLSWKTML